MPRVAGGRTRRKLGCTWQDEKLPIAGRVKSNLGITGDREARKSERATSGGRGGRLVYARSAACERGASSHNRRPHVAQSSAFPPRQSSILHALHAFALSRSVRLCVRLSSVAGRRTDTWAGLFARRRTLGARNKGLSDALGTERGGGLCRRKRKLVIPAVRGKAREEGKSGTQSTRGWEESGGGGHSLATLTNDGHLLATDRSFGPFGSGCRLPLVRCW